LPKINVKKNIVNIDCPFFWNTIEHLPKSMIISQFKKSGHWPHYEEQELFDERIEKVHKFLAIKI